MVTLDVSSVLLQAYELADLIKNSAEMQEFLEAQQNLARDLSAQQLISRFERVKEEYEEVQRFGSYHPDLHSKEAEFAALRAELEGTQIIARFRAAEDRLDKMLYHVSRTLARSVSHTVKVPRNNDADLATAQACGGSGCGSGGGCGSCGG